MEGKRSVLEIMIDDDWLIYKNGKYNYEFSKDSSTGANFSFTIEARNEEDLRNEIIGYAEDFDIDGYAEMQILARHDDPSIPQSIRKVLDDAEAIKEMLNDLSYRIQHNGEANRVLSKTECIIDDILTDPIESGKLDEEEDAEKIRIIEEFIESPEYIEFCENHPEINTDIINNMNDADYAEFTRIMRNNLFDLLAAIPGFSKLKEKGCLI